MLIFLFLKEVSTYRQQCEGLNRRALDMSQGSYCKAIKFNLVRKYTN